MIKIQWITLAIILCLNLSARAQKYELESRIRDSEMPVPALVHLSKAYPDRGRTQYYEEYSRHGAEKALTLFYESKFKLRRYRYSVKFDSLGRLHDVERRVKFDQLPYPVQQAVRDDLDKSFQHFRMEKIQEHFEPTGQLTGFEIEIRGKRNGTVGYFEVQYDTNGQRQSLESIESESNPFFFF
jgi:hypothetical protein